MVREFSGNNSDSDPSFDEESSDDTSRARKLFGGRLPNHAVSKRVRQDSDSMTINYNDKMADSADGFFSSQSSLRCSQNSFTDDLSSSQTMSLNSQMPEYCSQLTSESVVMHSSQPSTITSYDVDSNHRVNTKGKQANNNKRGAKGKQSQSSSQESNEDEVYKREKQKEKNRMYAQGSRERKTQKMNSLEQTNKSLTSVIQIYTKAIDILYKKLHPGAAIRWAKYNIQWYNNIDGKSAECQTVECLLPVGDQAFFEELGNAPFGTILATNLPILRPGDLLLPDSTTTRGSDVVMASNSGGIFTHRTVSNPAPNPTRMSQTTNCPSFLPRGSEHTQNTSAELESTDCTGVRQNRSGGMLHFPTLANAVKLEPNEMVHRGGFISLQIPSSQMSIVSNDTSNLMPSRQIITNISSPSIATTSTENISVPTYLDKNFHAKRLLHSGSNFTGKQATPKLGSDVASATVNSFPDAPSIPNISGQNYMASCGNNFNTAVSEDEVYIKQSDNEPAFEHTDGYLSLSSPENSQHHSSTESVDQETPEIEDLQFTLETA